MSPQTHPRCQAISHADKWPNTSGRPRTFQAANGSASALIAPAPPEVPAGKELDCAHTEFQGGGELPRPGLQHPVDDRVQSWLGPNRTRRRRQPARRGAGQWPTWLAHRPHSRRARRSFRDGFTDLERRGRDQQIRLSPQPLPAVFPPSSRRKSTTTGHPDGLEESWNNADRCARGVFGSPVRLGPVSDAFCRRS